MTLFGLVRRAIAARKSPATQFLIVFGAVALSAAFRWFVDRGAYGTPFVTFVPIVVLAAVFLEWPYAVLSAFLSTAVVVTLFGEHARIALNFTNYSLWGAFVFIAAFMIVTGHVLRRTIIELDTQAEKIRSFNAELQHRTKNTLQVVRALARRASHATDPAEFYETLSGRLDAMATANELLGLGTLKACQVPDLIEAALRPFPTSAIEVEGPACTIASEPGMQLMMVLHELGTNAVKYGALSCDGGRVSILWTHRKGAIDLLWEERGGPPVIPPTKIGLGTRMMTPSGDLQAVDLDFRPEGLVCKMSVATAAA